MNKTITRYLLPLFLTCILCAVAHPAFASEEMPAFNWWGNSLAIGGIEVDPEKIVNNPSPESQRYIYIHFVCPEEDLPIEVVATQFPTLRLIDGQGKEYPGAAYMPHAIIYNENNGVFTTAFQQPSFDVLFIVPADIQIDTFMLRVDINENEIEEIPFSDPVVAERIVY